VLPGAVLKFWPLFVDPISAGETFNTLVDELNWHQPVISLFGKRVLSPRLCAWCSDADVSYRYSGVTHRPHPWHGTVAALRDRIHTVVDARFNSCLLNYYRDGDDAMGWHSDDEPELGEKPVIASLSLGETRTFQLKSKSKQHRYQLKVPLASGSLLIMAGDTQTNYKHAVNRSRRVHGGRVNLTFRTIRR
jgi:alkylated DNA repair dioxygenase AlkB